MQRKSGRSAALFVSAVGLVVALGAPAAAAGTNQFSGVASLGACAAEFPLPPGYDPLDYSLYPTIVMTGDLEGCWYTHIITAKDLGTPSGVYLETGEEVFVGSLDDGDQGWFATTYKFQSKWDPEVTGGVEVHGRCEHPITAGSGHGGFEGATGRVDFKDDVVNLVFDYRGHIKLG